MFNWIKDRLMEYSTHQGAIVAAVAACILFAGMPLMEVVLWGALVWGVWSVLKSEF